MKDFSQILAKRTIIAFLLLLSISGSSQLRDDIKFEDRKQIIRVLAVEQPSTYLKSGLIQSGLDYEVLQKFADDFGYKLKITSVHSLRELQSQMRTEKFDLSMGRFNPNKIEVLFGETKNTILEQWNQSASYDSDRLAISCKNGFDLSKNKNLLLLSPATETFKSSLASFKKQTRMKVRYSGQLNSQKFFQDFIQGPYNCIISFQNEARFFKKSYPVIEIYQELNTEIPFVFLIANENEKLQEDFNKWISLTSKRNLADQIKRQMAGRHLPLSDFDYSAFVEARSEKLPLLKQQFVKYSKQFFLPWELMAAIAYQESRWNNEARSFTGVRGLMQITEETAEFLGLEDRLDIEKSIEAACKYVRLLYDRTPKYLAGKDRIALALATYNVGPAHMIDAQNLAIRLGKNPYSWNDLKNVLPLLSSDEFSHHFKYGKARGHEPVQFVNYVFNYFEILKTAI